MKPEPLAGAIKRAADLYGKINHGDRKKLRDALDRLIPDLTGQGAAAADLIIEAVPEKLDLGKRLAFYESTGAYRDMGRRPSRQR